MKVQTMLPVLDCVAAVHWAMTKEHDELLPPTHALVAASDTPRLL